MFLYYIYEVILNLFRGLWLKRANRTLANRLTSLGIQNGYTPTAGRVEASIQLAYLQSPTRLQFVDGGEWAAGLYSKRVENAGQWLTVFMRRLDYQSPHLYFDYKANNALYRIDFPLEANNAELVKYESFMSNRFNLYAPKGYHIDSLVVAAPDVLDSIDLHHMGADIEILGNQLYYIFPKAIKLGDKLEMLIAESEQLAAAINDNLSRYRDNRSGIRSKQISTPGKRLSKR